MYAGVQDYALSVPNLKVKVIVFFAKILSFISDFTGSTYLSDEAQETPRIYV